MPNRMLREGILTSERVNQLGAQAEILYRRLMSVVDDFGRYHGHSGLIRAACYPLRVDQVREADISRWLAEVQLAGLLVLYSVDGKRYLQLLDTRWQVRANASKFPECLRADANICAQMRADAPVVVVVDEDVVVDVGVVEKTADKPPGIDPGDVDLVYQAYPLKVAKPAALRAIEKALRKNPLGKLLEATQGYARARTGADGKALPFTPHPATWFNNECFNDPPETWRRDDGNNRTGNNRVGPGQVHDPDHRPKAGLFGL